MVCLIYVTITNSNTSKLRNYTQVKKRIRGSLHMTFVVLARTFWVAVPAPPQGGLLSKAFERLASQTHGKS
jgi:hypothetical protein